MLDASGRKQGFWIETDIAVGRYRIECFYKDDTLHGSYKTYNKHNQLSGYATPALAGVLHRQLRSR